MIRILVTLFLIAAYSVVSHAQNKVTVVDKDIQLVALKDSVYMHITWHEDVNFGRFSSNGLIVINDGKALMIDTPADNEKTKRLVTYLADSMHVILEGLIIGHFHEDCLGGLGYIKSIGVKSIANSRTIEKCATLNLPLPSVSFNDSLALGFQDEEIVCRYFGGGHTIDNIVVWMKGSKILFGGCLIKELQSTNLGNLQDAVLSDWSLTVEGILKTYPDIDIVIPGHGLPGGSELLLHTIDLVKRTTK